jgi:arylsulfatase A-like enzyme
MKYGILFASILLCAVPQALLFAADGPAEKLNLLVIHCDELNFHTLGCYRRLMPPEQAFIWGEKAVVATPHVDWLAQHGAISTRFYFAIC